MPIYTYVLKEYLNFGACLAVIALGPATTVNLMGRLTTTRKTCALFNRSQITWERFYLIGIKWKSIHSIIIIFLS